MSIPLAAIAIVTATGLEDMHKPQHTKVINGKKMKGQ